MPRRPFRLVPLRIRHVARDFYVPRGELPARVGHPWFAWRTRLRLTNGPHW